MYYQKVAPVDKQLGSQRQLQVPDLLAALAIVAHLSSLYLRVADIGGHNLGWGIEPLAIGAEANHILQERALRHRPHVPLILFDAGRWRESPAISFPGAKATKGLLGLIERYPDFLLGSSPRFGHTITRRPSALPSCTGCGSMRPTGRASCPVAW